MIIAFSPEQAHEVSQAFDAPWFMSESLYPTYIHKEESEKAEGKDKTSNDDTKPATKESTDKSNEARHPNSKKNMPHPCRNYQRVVRCARQALNQRASANSKTIEQRTPIHYDDESPHVAKMSLDVTGFPSEDIDIHVEEFVVSIKGERTNKLGDVFVLDRRFRLDKKTAIVDGVTASIEDGILELTVPKKSIAGPRKIPISVSTSSTEDILSTSQDQELDSNHEDEVVADSVKGVEHSEASDSKQENENDSIEVETVTEDDTTNGRQVQKKTQAIVIEPNEKETQTIGINADSVNSKSAEDEAWEEVSEWSIYLSLNKIYFQVFRKFTN